MLMVVFGAGASFDSFPSAPAPSNDTDFNERPPLASQLFASRDYFRDIARRYPKCLPLIPELEPRSQAGLSVEEVLQEYQARDDPEARSQLWSIRYYLRALIQDCELRWTARTRGVSNYSSLYNQARRLGHVCFVTFNYDTLLERALTQFDIQFPNLSNYIDSQSCILVKLHGSIDWIYWIRKLSTTMLHNEPNELDLIRSAPAIDPAALLRKVGDTPREALQEIYFQVPALAIPVVSKSNFVCPDDHLGALRKLLPQVTHIAAIGWSAGEQHFLDLLTANLKQHVAVTAVCGAEAASKDVLKRIENAGVKGTFTPVPETFTEFVRVHGIESLLR